MAQQFCTECGARRTGERFCTECGHAFPEVGADAPTTVAPVVPAATAPAPPVPVSPWTDPSVPEPAWQRPRRDSRRARVGPLVVGLVLVLLLGAAGGAWALLSRDDEPSARSPRQAADPTASATEAASTESSPSSSPEPSRTASPTRTRRSAPTAAPPPFSLGIPFRNVPCTGEYVVMLGTAGSRDIYVSKLSSAIEGVPSAKLLRGEDSCDAFIDRDPVSGDQIYNAYTGPYATLDQACSALASLPSERAWIRELSNPSKQRELCTCPSIGSSTPTLRPGTDVSSLPVRRAVNDVQWALFSVGILAKDDVNGTLGDNFFRAVGDYQYQQNLSTTGEVDPQTWSAVLDDYCPPGRYVYRH